MWRAALRADIEALKLFPADIKCNKVSVRSGKGPRRNGGQGKYREVIILAGAVAMHDRWMGVRLDLGFGDPDSELAWRLHGLRHSRAIELSGSHPDLDHHSLPRPHRRQDVLGLPERAQAPGRNRRSR